MNEIVIFHGDGNNTKIHAQDINQVRYARDKNGVCIGYGGWFNNGIFISPWFEHSPKGNEWETVQGEIERGTILYDGPEMGAHAVYWERP